jgi:hypothetical protein
MDYKIVFYSAQRTSVCERALKKRLAANQLTHGGSVFAVNNGSLGEQLAEAFRTCDIAFLVGGLGFSDSRNAAHIISNAAADCDPELVRKLKGVDGHDGFMLKSGDKLMVLLPDDPEQIEAIAQGELSGYLRYFVKSS